MKLISAVFLLRPDDICSFTLLHHSLAHCITTPLPLVHGKALGQQLSDLFDFAPINLSCSLTMYLLQDLTAEESGLIPAAFWTLDGQHHACGLLYYKTTRLQAKLSPFPGLYLSLLVKTRVVRGRLLHTSTIFPQHSAVLEWQLEAARWFPKRPCRFYEITIKLAAEVAAHPCSYCRITRPPWPHPITGDLGP